ncbi:hypothetical protein HDK77DRAFT_312367 [Phyllosticta capitalensis]|uniref:Uncharacterized protein n=1 Tax=Phyllosticta capitalensis TaxID=121624 RepID=A0ABR1YJ39_9PEZI
MGARDGDQLNQDQNTHNFSQPRALSFASSHPLPVSTAAPTRPRLLIASVVSFHLIICTAQSILLFPLPQPIVRPLKIPSAIDCRALPRHLFPLFLSSITYPYPKGAKKFFLVFLSNCPRSSKGLQDRTHRLHSIWTLTPESRSPSVSSRPRIGVTLPQLNIQRSR